MDSLYVAGDFVRTIKVVQGTPVSVPEEIAYNFGWISREQILARAEACGNSEYGAYLRRAVGGRLVPLGRGE